MLRHEPVYDRAVSDRECFAQGLALLFDARAEHALDQLTDARGRDHDALVFQVVLERVAKFSRGLKALVHVARKRALHDRGQALGVLGVHLLGGGNAARS